jgi:2,3-bisphosphoglycerate-independent phosphoglycerate mutase
VCDCILRRITLGPVVLLVLDGWGISPEKRGNAIALANAPNYKKLLEQFPHSRLKASGTDVGLPAGLMGNSEVGHLTIGAGRVITQKLTIISQKIADGSFFSNPALLKAIEKIQPGGTLHLIGLLSDGCVHSSLDHLDALLELSRRHGLKQVVVHPILDGRDTPPRSALKFVKQLVSKLKEEKVGVVSGRYYAMDRDKRWERTEKYWKALVLSDAPRFASAEEAIEHSYAIDISDEFVEPVIVHDQPPKDGDSVICFNFRPDRVRQLSRVLTQENFDGFARPRFPKIFYVCMTEYDQSLNLPIAFDATTMHTPTIENTLPEILSCHHIGQLHTAETEKYAHVTYFFNGGKEAELEGEDRTLVPSLKVATYDKAPAMQTPVVCESTCQAIRSGKYPFIVVNFANPDMVGHTGILEAGVEAVESVDKAFGLLLETIQEQKGTLLITADHGNCEQMIDLATGEPHTAHTTNPVPFIVASFQSDDALGLRQGSKVLDGSLADVAPTVLSILGLPQPQEMRGHSLISSLILNR